MSDFVVITGTGIVSSIGQSDSAVWNSLLDKKQGIRPIEGFNASGFDCRVAAQVNGPNPSELGIHPRDARIMDKHTYMLMKCTRDAFQQAGLDTASIRGEEIGFFAGMGMVDYEVEDLLSAVLRSRDPEGNIDYDAFFSGGYNEIYPLWPLSMLNNIGFCQVAIDLGLKGENNVFSPAADSGAQAVIEGMNTLLEKKAKAVLAGGVSEKVSASSLARAHLSGILNGNDNVCSPFKKDGGGTVLGEGCGIIAMELRSSADERGAPYSTKITGYGSAFDCESGSSGPTIEAIYHSMGVALYRAGVSSSEINAIIAHGDGTRNGDKNELEAINRLFSDDVYLLNIFASKGAMGHLLAGAPAVDIILGTHMIEDGTIPATPNAAPPGEDITSGIINRHPVKAFPKKILVNCQSYEGQSTSIILESVVSEKSGNREEFGCDSYSMTE